jgi:hypothetical protein
MIKLIIAPQINPITRQTERMKTCPLNKTGNNNNNKKIKHQAQ